MLGKLIDLGVEQGIVRKSGAWYTYDGDQLGQGKENARNFLRKNPDLSDEIEKKILPPFKEPRLYLALGRGALGSGRLRSEAYTGDQLKQQLDDLQKEFVSEQTMIRIDRSANQVSVTPIISWHDAEFTAAYDPGATGIMAQRSPVERAIVAFVTPHLLPLEKELLQKNEFKVTYHPFDWRLNDLTGGPPQ